jgi:RNA polymerase-binding transcription factor DksA
VPRCRACSGIPRRQGSRTGRQKATGDIADPAQPLAVEGMDDAIAASLCDRLAARDRAEQRLDNGTYGRSIRSGIPIPDERLEADPAAEGSTVSSPRATPAAVVHRCGTRPDLRLPWAGPGIPAREDERQ